MTTGGTLLDQGTIVGARYRIDRYIGAGGMQEVYLASDLLLSRKVALKAPKNVSAEKRFQRSAIVSARVNHANVAKTLDYIDDSDSPFLIEEFIEGQDLSKVLKSSFKVLDPMITALIFHRLAKGLAASHHAGVIHRDLKPSNIMAVDGALLNDVKITDFGIAKMAEEEIAEAVEGGDESITASQTAIGALPYMAPEMIGSMKDAGRPADVWSIGALIFELLSGSKPFGSGLRAVPAILSGKLPAIPQRVVEKPQFKSLGSELYSLVQECMTLDQTKRPTADDLILKCEGLCYPITPRECGTVSKFDNGYWGFISPDEGKGVFFHVDSVYLGPLKVGDRVSFARHDGSGSDRAFPILKKS